MVLPTVKNGSMNYRSNLLHFADLYDQGCFVFGDIKGVVTANDIADIFGIPNKGRNLEYTLVIAECLNKSLVHASKPHLVTGCVPSLLFWFGGKTRLLTPIIGR
ncbi:hypothetical protein ACFX13_022584 [Malus domestica]